MMENGNVVDIRTGRTLFTEEVRVRLEEGIGPFLREGAPYSERARAVTAVEQVLCAALISAAVGLATKLAARIAGKFTV